MAFYLLIIVVAFFAIFGILHSPNAREKLQLITSYSWSINIIKNFLKPQQEHVINVEIIGSSEITADESEPRPASLDSVEEINGIRLRTENVDVKSTINDVGSGNQSTPDLHPHQNTMDRQNVLAAINASLHQLSVAANSGEIGSAQLYEILVQETRLYEKAMQGSQVLSDENEPEDNINDSNTVIEEIHNDQSSAPANNQQDKPKMYFGESPIDYVPSQQ